MWSVLHAVHIVLSKLSNLNVPSALTAGSGAPRCRVAPCLGGAQSLRRNVRCSRRHREARTLLLQRLVLLRQSSSEGRINEASFDDGKRSDVEGRAVSPNG